MVVSDVLSCLEERGDVLQTFTKNDIYCSRFLSNRCHPCMVDLACVKRSSARAWGDGSGKTDN
jgi:hypothetical protein